MFEIDLDAFMAEDEWGRSRDNGRAFPCALCGEISEASSNTTNASGEIVCQYCNPENRSTQRRRVGDFSEVAWRLIEIAARR